MVDLNDAPLEPGDAVAWHLDSGGHDVAIPAVVVSGTRGDVNVFTIRLDGSGGVPRFFAVDGSELRRTG
jgi:hypothetical protein